MNNIRILIVLVCLLAGIILLQKLYANSQTPSSYQEKSVKAAVQKTIPSPLSPSQAAIVDKTEEKDTSDVSRLAEKESFIYPKAFGIYTFDNTILFESNDDPVSITKWYRELIHKNNMTTKTFVTTNSNDNVLNKLVGLDENKEIRIEIIRSSRQQKVTVLVTVISY